MTHTETNAAGAFNPLQALQAMTDTDKNVATDGHLPASDKSDVDLSRIPELPEVMSTKVGRALTGRLTVEQNRVAKEIASKMQLNDMLEIDSFGSEFQENGRRMARDSSKFLMEHVKAADLGEVGELGNEMKRRFANLGLGQVSLWEKLLDAIPFVKVDKLKKFIDGRQSMAELMGDIREATATKSAEVELFYNRLAGKIKDVKATVSQLTVVGAVVEMKIGETEEKYRSEVNRLKKVDKLDDEDLDSIYNMKQTLSALDMKLAHVKAMRTMLRQSAENFRILREGMGIGISKLNNQLQIQDLVWTVKIDEAISIRELQKLNTVVQTSEEFTNKLVSINLENLDSALRTIFAEAGKPGVSIELLTKSAEAQKVLVDSINQSFVENRKKLAQAAAQLDDIDTKFAERGTDLQTLMQMLEVANMDQDEKAAA